EAGPPATPADLAEDHEEDQPDDDHADEPARRRWRGLGRRCRHGGNRANVRVTQRGTDRLRAGEHRLAGVSLAHLRGDDVADDAARDEVGQVALEAAADLDAQLVVVVDDEQQDAVVLLLGAHAPLPRQLDAVVLERVVTCRVDDRHRDLVAGALLIVEQLGVDLLRDVGRDDVDGVHQRGTERRDRRRAAGRRRDENRSDRGGDRDAAREPHGLAVVGGAVVEGGTDGAGPRSTVGTSRDSVVALKSGFLSNPNIPANKLRGKRRMLVLYSLRAWLIRFSVPSICVWRSCTAWMLCSWG